MKRKSLSILFIIVLSFGLLLTGCSSSSSDNESYIIGGNVTINEGIVENVILRVDDAYGISTVHPDSNGKWNMVVSGGDVTVTPFYDRDKDGINDYDFAPPSWSKYVGADRFGIDFTGISISKSMVQEMLGDWEFTYNISTNTYIEYYVFNDLREDSKTGQYYAYGYKEAEYSSSSGYTEFGPDNIAFATYLEKGGTYTVLWLSPDVARYGSYFEFNFNTSTTVAGQYYMITDGTLELPDPMTGKRTATYSSALSIEDNSEDKKAQELFNQLIQKHGESKEVSVTSGVNDAGRKIEIKEKALTK